MILLTSLYLCFELAFNARLLDVVGGMADADELHHIERFGRSLSGIAVALVVLQIMMSRRAKLGLAGPSNTKILVFCGIAAVLTYIALQSLVDFVVESRSDEFRKASTSIVLVQRALIDGQVELDGLVDKPHLFATPEGKAFLALFPALVISVDRLEDKIHSAKFQLLTQRTGQEMGGVQGYYKHYVQAMNETQAQWQKYRTHGNVDSAQNLEEQQDKAWADYLVDLGKRGWTPTTVPAYARGKVAATVRQRIPVPHNWLPDDEVRFREAVAVQFKRRVSAAKSGGKNIPPGLDYHAFVAHPEVQAELRKQLKMPEGVVVAASYKNGAAFDRELFSVVRDKYAKQELVRYDSPVSEFSVGGKQVELGLSAARAALVPPMALFFSLLGAIGHFTKLIFLIAKAIFQSIPALRERKKYLWLLPLSVLAVNWTILSNLENDVTQSRLYIYMLKQAQSKQEQDTHPILRKVLGNALHVVAIGQAYGYPINEHIRTNVLGGISYGYHPKVTVKEESNATIDAKRKGR
ncbi:MAG: hypothetical protein HY253_13910 [Burkholderiales bacterium]|nr:hypothetical protein [Burkholderiales bacterium]